MKKILASFMVLTLLFTFAACKGAGQDEDGGQTQAEVVTLEIFAAASMTETLGLIKEQYKTVHPEVELVLTLDSSGTLKTQIEEGAVCDLFISAAQKQMNQLEEAGMISAQSRINMLENRCALVEEDGNPAGIESYEDLGTDKLTLIALGGADVPVGQYAEEILAHMGLWETLNEQGKITFGSNVNEVTAKVSEHAVDCGIVYGTDAAAAGLQVVAYPPEGSHSPILYPAALTSACAHPQQAQDFLDYLASDACASVFEAAGFTLVR